MLGLPLENTCSALALHNLHPPTPIHAKYSYFSFKSLKEKCHVYNFLPYLKLPMELLHSSSGRILKISLLNKENL